MSFHVGSGCKNAQDYYNVIKNCRELFDIARNQYSYEFHLLDLGGGFSALTACSTTEKASRINEALDEFFPERCDSTLRIIAEPGRYFAEKIFTLFVPICSKKVLSNGSQVFSIDDSSKEVDNVMYYMTEGLFSGFLNYVVIDSGMPKLKPTAFYSKGEFFMNDENIDHTPESVIWGPTCHGHDCISRELKLPMLDIGDWIVFENFGAYSMAASTSFNGFSNAKVYWLDNY